MFSEKEQNAAEIFLPYYTARSQPTQKRQRRELTCLSTFAATQGVELGDLLAETSGWAHLTGTLVQAYLVHLDAQGYADNSIALQCYTFKRYARLAMQADALSFLEYQAIDAIRAPHKTESSVVYLSLTEQQVQALLDQPVPTRLGLRDALCMALLLRCGLWPKSIVKLNRSSFNLPTKALTSYDYHAQEWRQEFLDPKTIEIATHYLSLPSPHSHALFIGHRRPDSPSLRWSDRALNYRVQELGRRIGVEGLLPRDCHLYWMKAFADATRHFLLAAWKGEPPAEDDSSASNA